MADSPFGDIQAAVYTLLAGDAGLAALGAAVYDAVPETTAPPYVVIGEALEQPDNAHDRFGRQTVVTLHVWSRHRGFSEANAIVSRLVELLDHQPLAVAGRRHVVTRYEFAQKLKDPDDPGLRHIPIRFRILTEIEV